MWIGAWRYELVDGAIIAHAAPSPDHGAILGMVGVAIELVCAREVAAGVASKLGVGQSPSGNSVPPQGFLMAWSAAAISHAAPSSGSGRGSAASRSDRSRRRSAPTPPAVLPRSLDEMAGYLSFDGV